MKYKELRQKVENHPKYKGCVKIDRSPLINQGFPGTFNLSFTEDPWLKEYGRYVDFYHNYVFSTIQSCIRPSDIPLVATRDSSRYLGVFEMTDLTGIINLVKKPDFSLLQRYQVAVLLEFLESVGISKHRVHASYNDGGKVSLLTNGKYTFDFDVPTDVITRDAFVDNGVPEENLIVDKSRNSFLSPHLNRPTPWGYRNEVFVNLGTKTESRLLDICTLEYLLWRPVFGESVKSHDNGIIGLIEGSGISVNAVGLERLCMAVNGLERVQDVDYIKPFYEEMKDSTSEINYHAGESLRALHRLYSDITSFELIPGRHQKQKIARLVRNVSPNWDKKTLDRLLQVHSEAQPWHDNLLQGIGPTIERIERFRSVKRK